MHESARLIFACVPHSPSNQYRYMQAPGSIGLPTELLGTLGLADTCQARPDELVSEEGHAVIDGLVVEQAHGLRVVGLAEQALAGPKHDREDLQSQLVDQVGLYQRAHELEAGQDEDLAVQLLLELR